MSDNGNNNDNTKSRVLQWLLANAPRNQSPTDFGAEIIDVDALPDNFAVHQANESDVEIVGTIAPSPSGPDVEISESIASPPSPEQPRFGSPAPSNYSAPPHYSALTPPVSPTAPEPMVEDVERDERLIETPSSIGQILPGEPEAMSGWDRDSNSSVDLSDMDERERRMVHLERQLAQRERDIKSKEERIRKKEKELSHREAREMEIQVKKKIDVWLAKPKEEREPEIELDMIGYAMTTHPYLYLTEHERRRICKLRLELDEMVEKARRVASREKCCPVCFDTVKTPKTFVVPECGHLHCEICVNEMDKAAGPHRNARCSECMSLIEMEKLRKIYFASRI